MFHFEFMQTDVQQRHWRQCKRSALIVSKTLLCFLLTIVLAAFYQIAFVKNGALEIMSQKKLLLSKNAEVSLWAFRLLGNLCSNGFFAAMNNDQLTSFQIRTECKLWT